MTKSKTDKHLTLSYKKTISKSDLYLLMGVGNGKIDVFKELTPHSRTFWGKQIGNGKRGSTFLKN